MTPLYRVADLAHPRLLLTPAGGTQPEARRLRPAPARLVPVTAVPDGTWQAAFIDDRLRLALNW